MKIKDILKKQGEIYKDLPSNETIQEYNEKIEKPLKTAPSEPHISSGEDICPNSLMAILCKLLEKNDEAEELYKNINSKIKRK